MEKDLKLRNLIEANQVHVYAYHPSMHKQILALLKTAPKNCIFYPNEMVPNNELDEADLSDLSLKEFIFKEILPRCNFLQGEKVILGPLA